MYNNHVEFIPFHLLMCELNLIALAKFKIAIGCTRARMRNAISGGRDPRTLGISWGQMDEMISKARRTLIMIRLLLSQAP